MSTKRMIGLEDELKDRLEQYLADNEWQIAEIAAALRDADAGDFASDTEVAALQNKWQTDAH